MSKDNRLDRYHVVDRLGQGGSSEVFLGTDPFGNEVAVKVQRRARKRLRFMQEYEILNKFPHPSLVQVYEFGIMRNGWSYLILQLIDGKSATAHVRSFFGVERIDKCIEVAIKISEAFGSLHAMDWIHGDIKSKNILVTKEGNPILIDFELARPLNNTGNLKFFGTRSYAPPEQHDGLTLTTSVDVYAMAGVLYRMLTNKLPFKRVENDQEAELRRNVAPSISSKLPSKLRSLLLSALDPDPAKRPANGMIFAQKLRECLSSKMEVVITTEPPSTNAQIVSLLQQNGLLPELHMLEIVSISGGDLNLVSQFAYHQANYGTWLPKEYTEQIWHYIQQLPLHLQKVLYVLSCLGGMAPTSIICRFSGIGKKDLPHEMQKLPQWIRKEGHLWHLFVGTLHAPCMHLLDPSENLAQLQEIEKHSPKLGRLFLQALYTPQKALENLVGIIHTQENTLQLWRLLQRIKSQNLHVPEIGLSREKILELEKLIVLRRNGDWVHVLEILHNLQLASEAGELLEIYQHISVSHLPRLQELTQSKQLDVRYASTAILSEWLLLSGQFVEAEKLLIVLHKCEDVYPKIIALQQQALLVHHLDQQARLSQIYTKLDASAPFPISRRIVELIGTTGWHSNILSVTDVPSAYIQMRLSLYEKQPTEELLPLFIRETTEMDRAFLSVHSLWSSLGEQLQLSPQPKEEEFQYPVDSEGDNSCS